LPDVDNSEEQRAEEEKSKGIVGNVKGFFTNWWNMKAYSSGPQQYYLIFVERY
jgi:hypothetical protein